jgi:2-amino-4-hydroxy-6-hydroxymethyldihydropteridine diphosphokinase
MTLEMVNVYLGLGSNLGDRNQNLEKALDMLSQRMPVIQVSSVYDTEPMYNTEQPRFLNQVCKVTTRLEPLPLFYLIKGIESRMGRTGKTNEPRPIDIDILFYGDQVIETPELVIPHPRLAERAFVLMPLAEIAAELMHPVMGRTISELVSGLDGVQGTFKLEGG